MIYLWRPGIAKIHLAPLRYMGNHGDQIAVNEGTLGKVAPLLIQ